jgi:hypothetical protein
MINSPQSRLIFDGLEIRLRAKENDPGTLPWVVCNLFAQLGLRFYLGIREVWSAPTAVRMHIMCIHMAMAVMRIAISCILCL